MATILGALMEIVKKPTLCDMAAELAVLAAPIWIAVIAGVFVGWAWRPRWAADLIGEEEHEAGLACSSSSRVLGENPCQVLDREDVAVSSEDLQHLCRLVEVRDGGPVWQEMMEKSLPNMSYQAWRRDPELGPPQYRTRTVYEDVTPEIVRDFFWDDDFRMKNKWDDMLLHRSTLDECTTTGAMVVHWIRKFPFFCSDREYIIGRRIWESGRTYYCVTKGVPHATVPRKNKPRHVDLYYSSWCIRPVESRSGYGRQTACEVLLFHHEDMGIPWEVAKLGVRQGMWGAVRKIEPALRAYQELRGSGEPPSRCAFMAQINSKAHEDYLTTPTPGGENNPSSDIAEAQKKKNSGSGIPKFFLVGGAVALACTLDRGLLTKAVIFGVARRLAKLGKRV